MPKESDGKTKAKEAGTRSPNKEGPSRMPAAISPTTAGWPNRLKTQPMARDAATIRSSCRNRWLSGSVEFCAMPETSAAAADAPEGARSATVGTAGAPTGGGKVAPTCSSQKIGRPAAARMSR